MQIGHEFGMTQNSSVSSAVDRIKRKRRNDSNFRKKLTETVNTFKQVNKKCKLMIKHYQRGVNYIKKTTTINPL